MVCENCTNKARPGDGLECLYDAESRTWVEVFRCLYWSAKRGGDVYVNANNNAETCLGHTESYDSDRDVSGLLEEE